MINIPESDFYDREYSLKELIDTDVLDKLFQYIRELTPLTLYLVDQKGSRLFYKGNIPETDIRMAFKGNYESDLPDRIITCGEIILKVFPVILELETLGYLIAAYESRYNLPSHKIDASAGLLSKVTSNLIKDRYKYNMTAGLHGQVVEESFEDLRQKAELLEISQNKYRSLSENLEIEVKKKTKEIEKAFAILMHQENLASVGHLAAGIAHEINNPLGFICSNLHTLSEYKSSLITLLSGYRNLKSLIKAGSHKLKSTAALLNKVNEIVKLEDDLDIDFILEDMPKLIDESSEGLDRVKNIVMDLKVFAHPDEKDIQYADLNENIESTVNVLHNELREGIALVKNYGDIPRVKCNPKEINQLMMNIILNAIQAIDNKGKVIISTDINGKYVKITVKDTGSGISDENLSKIFNPFFTTKPVGQGTGLGLSTAYNTVKKHNGSLDIQSSPGEGTEVIINLPADKG